MPLNDKRVPVDDFDPFERSSFHPPHYDDPHSTTVRHGEAEAPPRKPIKATPFVWRDPKTIPPRRWLYGRHHIRKYATATIAPGGLGKTSLVLAEAVAMVTGRSLLGEMPRGRLRVWYWNGEDPLEEVERRVVAICLHYGIDPSELDGRLFLDSGRDSPIVIARRLKDQTVMQVPEIDEITSEIRDRKIDVLIIDPFVSCHDVPENDNGAIDKVTKTWGGIAGSADCNVELVHHVRKASGVQSGYTVEDARGGSALIGAVRSARVLNVMNPEEAANAGVQAEDRRRFFRVDDGKANMQPPQDRATWRELVSVGLGNSDKWDPEDLIGVVTPWTLPGVYDAIQPGDLRKVQEAIDGGTWAEDVRAANWAGKAVAQVMGLDATDKADKGRISRFLTLWKKNGTLKTETIRNTRAGRDTTIIVVGERV